MTDLEFDRKIAVSVRKEREATTQVLLDLRECERRDRALKKGYKSLHQYCVKLHKYSGGAADRRIAAMRLGAEEEVEKGLISLTLASIARAFINQDGLDRDEVIKRISGKSVREGQRILFEMAPNHIAHERVEVVSSGDEIRMHLTREEKELVDQLLETNYKDLLLKLVREKLNVRNTQRARGKPRREATSSVKSQKSKSRTARGSLRVQILEKYGHRCCFVGEDNRQCDATTHLEVDHINPWSFGGETEAENLRVLCWNHNQYMWKNRSEAHLQY